MVKKYQKDPEVRLIPVTCRFCKQLTGPTSTCFKNCEPQQIQIDNINSIIIRSHDCYFRNKARWNAEINFAVSEPLVNEIVLVKGIDDILVTGPYSFSYCISPLFDTTIVNRTLIHQIKSFAKRMQAIESHIHDDVDESTIKIKITMPNGNESVQEILEKDAEYFLNELTCHFENAKIEKL